MKSRTHNRAFTLLEVIVALTLIVTIVSAVYGTYLASVGSIANRRGRIRAAQEGRDLLAQMSRQIRCAYGGIGGSLRPLDASRPSSGDAENERAACFTGGKTTESGDLLQWVTTAAGVQGEGPASGLYYVGYKFEPRDNALLYRQQGYAPAAQEAAHNQEYMVLSNNVAAIDVSFFDGRRWHDRWPDAEKQMLPQAVKIELTMIDDEFNSFRFSTATPVNCAE